MSGQVLVLTPILEPHRVVSWQKAIHWLCLEKVEVLEEYDEILYQSQTLTIHMPAVVKLLRSFRGGRHSIKFSRSNVMLRDQFTCQYCGEKKPARELNCDHVVPRHLGGRTLWENIVTSCYPCNTRKRNRTPEQAGMKLLSIPIKPTWLPIVTPLRLSNTIPDLWINYVSWHRACDSSPFSIQRENSSI